MFRAAKRLYYLFASPSYKEYEKIYFYHTNKLYRIWLSDKPDVFLGLENELRFIHMRENNKNADLYFIYSASSLNEAAKTKLQAFCKQHRIMPVDFDSALAALLEHPADIELYANAKAELQHTLTHTGGNLAAAADCIRQIVAVNEHYGYYSDFDTKCCFDKLPSSEFQTQSPILFNGDHYSDENHNIILNSNSDFLAYAYDPEDPSRLHSDAVEAIRHVQQLILANYRVPFTPKTIYHNIDQLPEDESRFLEFIFMHFNQQYPEDLSVFNFRQSLQTLQLPTTTDITPLKRFIYDLSVIYVSGPGNYNQMFIDSRPPLYDYFPLRISPAEMPQWDTFFNIYNRSSICNYPALNDCVLSNNCMAKAKPLIAAGRQEEVRDASWTPEGAELKKQRELKLRLSAMRIFQIWRTGYAKHKELYLALKPTASVEVKNAIRHGQYNLAFRLASFQSDLTTIQVLIEYQDDIKLDINGMTSKGQTALDLASNGAVRQFLQMNGVSRGEELRLNPSTSAKARK